MKIKSQKKPVDYRAIKRELFLDALVDFLEGDQAAKSIALSLPDGMVPWAKQWAALRSATPLFGWSSDKEESRNTLAEFLGWK